jgi:hypothetical protein
VNLFKMTYLVIPWDLSSWQACYPKWI